VWSFSVVQWDRPIIATGERMFMPTSYEDVDEEAGAIETREACPIQSLSRVALGLPGEMI
jgi:hypothetical protein